MNQKVVMIVDDDLDLRDTISFALESEGYSIIKAENGRLALEILRNLPSDKLPDCIVLDMMMPEMDGKTFIEVLRREHPNDLAKIPILIATAKGSHTDPIALLPGTRKIRKPMELDDLFNQVADLCRRTSI